MKKIFAIIFVLYLSGCVQTASREPILGINAPNQRVAIINGYPNEVYAFSLGFTRFQNKLEKIPFPEWNPAQAIESGTREILGEVNGIEIIDVTLSHSDIQTLMFNEHDTAASYEKRITSNPAILSKIADQGADSVVMIVPSNVLLYNTSVYLPGTGIYFIHLGSIDPYSSFKLYIINTASNEIVGAHELSDTGGEIYLKNDLPKAEMERLLKQHADSKKYDDHYSRSLKSLISSACASMDRLNKFGAENRARLVEAMNISINHSLAKLRQIYLGTPLPEKTQDPTKNRFIPCT